MKQDLVVAVPWSLTHYIPLNGFHPLYSALFNQCPHWVRLNAWDNTELSQKLRGDSGFRDFVISGVRQDIEHTRTDLSKTRLEYTAHFWSPNRTLTELIPGDIELQHTAPFPSMKRPFVLHCESFAPVFFPFAHQGTGSFGSKELYNHYKEMFESPLCLGIFSHLPHTLEDFRRYFRSPEIDKRLFSSRIGMIYGRSASILDICQDDTTIFLFINSAHQREGNFFLRGGHLVLRYWQLAASKMKNGRLIMRCRRPSDQTLARHGVDLEWLYQKDRNDIVWIQDYLSDNELNSLFERAHFFLLPSNSLHSVSVMQAMSSGAIPIVTDTLGSDRYIDDDINGIILSGVKNKNWIEDPDTGILVDVYRRDSDLELNLIEQMNRRIAWIASDPCRFKAMSTAAQEKAKSEFCGQAFSHEFWDKVSFLYQQTKLVRSKPIFTKPLSSEFGHCFLDHKDWSRVFSSTPQPLQRLYTGTSSVFELGGNFISLQGNGPSSVHWWSPVAQYCDDLAPELSFAASINGLSGVFLREEKNTELKAPSRLILFFSEILQPYPFLYSSAAYFLKILRRARAYIRFRNNKAAGSNDIIVDYNNIELVMENFKGFNIVRCGFQFYAIRRTDGEFSLKKIADGDYEEFYTGSSFKEIYGIIKKLPNQEDIELIQMDVSGMNIIRYNDRYYGIPMSEGSFEINRIHLGEYSRVVEAGSADEVRDAIWGN